MTARLFLGLPVPASAREKIKAIAGPPYKQYFENFVPDENWHLTLFFFGEVKNPSQYFGYLKLPLPQAFTPTVSLTHIGRGKQRDQLWAFAQPTTSLLALRQALGARLQKVHFPRAVNRNIFVPHIRLANFFPIVSGMGLADTAAGVAYAVQEAYLYKSEPTPQGSKYTILAAIKLAA